MFFLRENADGNWSDVTAMVYDGSSTKSALGFQFSPVGSAPDVDVDLEPGRPEKPGDKDPETCKHNWEETSRTEAACSHAGTVEYTCSKCGSTKTETLAKLKHVWELKQTTQTAYDEEGNVVTQGFTIYRCSLCGEEYKDTDGTGPPGSSGSDPDDEPGGDGFWDKVGELLGSANVDYEWLAPGPPFAQPSLQPVEDGPDRCPAAARQSEIPESFPPGAPPVCTALLFCHVILLFRHSTPKPPLVLRFWP